MTTIEAMTFRIDDADRAALVELDERFQQEVAYQAPGLRRRTTAASSDGHWLIVTVWRNRAAATAGPRLADSALGREMLTMIEDLAVEFYDTVT